MSEERIRIQELEQENAQLRKRLEEAEAENAAKESFLSSTPMNAIVGMTALAKKHIDEKPRVSDALNKIETASGHLLSLINDVLDMSRINSGRMKLVQELFSLSDLLHDTMTIVRPQIAQKGHSYELLTENIVAEGLYGDALRLRQIFVNIINNAVKYTPDGGHLVIRIAQLWEGERCRMLFQCRDNGIGMTPEFLERIFEPFERVNTAAVARIEGTGLGMSIVKKLVEAMDGQIDLESEPGKGTCVNIRIPFAVETLSVRTDALKGQRLLVLEADAALQALYAQYLGEANIEHTVVPSVQAAFAALADADVHASPYGAVIIGKQQQSSDSVFDIAAYLNKSYPAMPLVLVSDEDWEKIEYRARRSGVREFIPLPFFRKSLLNALNEALSSSVQEDGGLTPNLEGMRILLVEDNFINREIAKEILSATNAKIDTAEDGKQAVEQFLASEPGWYHLILMDVQMPVMDGYAATGVIRASGRPDAESTPIYAMTANTFAEDIARARAAGMNGHIAKPVDINTLMQTLRQIRN